LTTTGSIITPKIDELETGLKVYIDLRAVCPWCGQQIIFGADCLHVNFEYQLQKHQGYIIVHTHPECGRQVIVKGNALQKYSGAKKTWELTPEEKSTYIPRQGDMFKYDAGEGEKIYIIKILPSMWSDNTLDTIIDYQAKMYSPWGVWFNPGKGNGRTPRTLTIEAVEKYTGLSFPRYTRRT
jgi:hypothetical protein